MDGHFFIPILLLREAAHVHGEAQGNAQGDDRDNGDADGDLGTRAKLRRLRCLHWGIGHMRVIG